MPYHWSLDTQLQLESREHLYLDSVLLDQIGATNGMCTILYTCIVSKSQLAIYRMRKAHKLHIRPQRSVHLHSRLLWVALRVKWPWVSINIHRMIQFSQLWCRPSIVLDQCPFNWLAKILLESISKCPLGLLELRSRKG